MHCASKITWVKNLLSTQARMNINIKLFNINMLWQSKTFVPNINIKLFSNVQK